jgi:glycosyltransferase involved in cell wall biosynthesis
MSVYKNESPIFFKLCLKSLLTQTHKAAEVVLVEDGPLPTSLKKLIEEFRSSLKIKSIKLPVNKGLGNALNEGLKHCSFPFVARMDTDDIAYETRFFEQLNYMNNHPDVDLCGSYSTEINEDGVQGNLRKMPVVHDIIINNLWTNPFIHPTIIFNKEKMLAIGGYDAELSRRQDYELWFRCAYNGFKFANIPLPLIYYRFGTSTHKKQTRSVCLLQARIGYRGSRKVDLSIFKALLCYVPYLRSFFPQTIQHMLYKGLKKFDPRNS